MLDGLYQYNGCIEVMLDGLYQYRLGNNWVAAVSI